MRGPTNDQSGCRDKSSRGLGEHTSAPRHMHQAGRFGSKSSAGSYWCTRGLDKVLKIFLMIMEGGPKVVIYMLFIVLKHTQYCNMLIEVKDIILNISMSRFYTLFCIMLVKMIYIIIYMCPSHKYIRTLALVCFIFKWFVKCELHSDSFSYFVHLSVRSSSQSLTQASPSSQPRV